MKINGDLHASSSFNWIFPLILITTCSFRAASGQCGFACPLNYDPICGSNGVTYGNECEMRAANCRSQTGVTMAYRGRCREASDHCGFACTLIHDPICGSDGVTYSNECGMRSANCRSQTNVTMAYRGRCREESPPCGFMCPQNYDPICGSDGVTYSNECGMRSANCRSQTNVTKAYRGRCREGPTTRRSCDTVCLTNYDPVCGSDGRTYGNECELLSRRCVTKSRLRVVCRGVCRRSRSRRLTCRQYRPTPEINL